MNTPTSSDLSCFRIVHDERDGAFFLHAYSAAYQGVVEVSHHWERADAERDLATRLLGRQVRAIAGVHASIFSVVGTVLELTATDAVVEFNGKRYTCPVGWFSYYFQSIL